MEQTWVHFDIESDPRIDFSPQKAPAGRLNQTKYMTLGSQMLKKHSFATKLFVLFCKSTIFSATATQFHVDSLSGLKNQTKSYFQKVTSLDSHVVLLLIFRPEMLLRVDLTKRNI